MLRMYRWTWSCPTATVVGLALLLASAWGQPNEDVQRCTGAEGGVDERIAACTRAIASGPVSGSDVEPLFVNRGIAWARKGNFDRALADFNEAIQRNPQDARAYFNRGGVWLRKNAFDRAIADYSEVIGLNPHDAPLQVCNPDGVRCGRMDATAYKNRGIAWGQKGDHDRAIADFAEAIERDPQDAQSYFNRGFTWGQKGDFDRAIPDLDEAIRLNPQFAHAYYVRGLVWTKKGERDRANADFSEASRLNPKLKPPSFNP